MQRKVYVDAIFRLYAFLYVNEFDSKFMLSCAAQGTGELIIGKDGVQLTERLQLTTNSPSTFIPVSLRATVPIQGQVNITCYALESQPGYSKLQLDSRAVNGISARLINTNVSIRLLNPGRQDVIQCIAISNNASNLQFNQTSSTNNLTVIGFLSPKLYSTSDQVLVSTYTTVWNSTFVLRFGENLTADVNINCSVHSSVNGLADSLEFLPFRVNSISTEDVVMPFHIRNKTALTINSANVTCFAQSLNGTQYLSATSATSMIEFKLDVATATLWPNAFGTVTNTSFNATLALSKGLEDKGLVEFRCDSLSYSSENEARSRLQRHACALPNYESPTDPLSSVQNNSADEDNSNWTIKGPSRIILTADTNPLYTVLSVERTSHPSYSLTEYVVLLCCSVLWNDLQYAGIAVSSAVKLEYIPSQPLNTSLAKAGTTVIQNPAYINIAPCPCDLTVSRCDINCCCDQDCSNSTKETFSFCEGSVWGGEPPPPADHWCNQSQRPTAPDWAPILCTHFETNAYLGLFYPPSDLTSDVSSYVQAKAKVNAFTYRNPVSAGFASALNSVGYRKGFYIQTSGSGYLSVPQQTLTGYCLETSPVRFLEDLESSCTVYLTQNTCSGDSMLNIRNYLQPAIPNSLSTDTVRVVDSYGSETYIETAARYFCTSDLQTEEIRLRQSADYLLSEMLALTNVPPENVFGCDWDNGRSLRPVPTLSHDMCSNVLRSSQYMLTYNNTRLVKVEVSYILANVKIGSADKPTELSTKHIVTFLQAGANTSTRYSGKPGYNMNTRLYAAVEDMNTGSLVASSTPSIPVSGVGGLCESASLEPILFPTNYIAQCLMTISYLDMKDCDKLRSMILRKINSLYSGKYISRFGIPDHTRKGNWVPILRKGFEVFEDTNVDTNATNITVPVYRKDDLALTVEQPIRVSGRCTRIPTAAELQFMYALTGRSGGHPIYQIIGAQLSVLSSTWTLHCSLAECNDLSSEDKALTFSASFVQVSAVRPASPPRYNAQKMEQCEQCELTWSFDSVFHPISNQLPEAVRADNLAKLLFLFGMFCCMFLFSRPWWHTHYNMFV